MSNMQRIILVYFFLFMLYGCKDQYSSHPVRQNGLIHCSSIQPRFFNPQLTDGGIIPDSVSRQVFERLIKLEGNNFSPTPMLASSWKISNKGKEYLFTLRKDVHFHSNRHFSPTRLLNAEDVVFSFSRLIDKNNPFHNLEQHSYPWFESLGFADLLLKVEAINNHQVKFTLKHADASFLSILASSYAVIHSAEYANELVKTNQLWLMDIKPIGTGAFWFDEYQADRFIRLKRHPLYRNGAAQLQQVVYDISQRGISDLTKLIAKECDILPNISTKQLSVIKNNSSFKLIPQAPMNVAFLSLNTKHPHLAKPLVRQAIDYAIDKEKLIESVYQGLGIIASSLLPPASWAHDKQVAKKYDPQLSMSLLAHAGLMQGFEIDLLVPLVARPYNPNPLKMAKLIQADLAKVNIKVNLLTKKVINNKLWKEEMLDLGMVLEGWVADNADPDNFFRPNLSCEAISSGLNLSNWCNKQYEDLLDRAIKIQKRGQRRVLYGQLQQLIRDTLPVIPLAHGRYYKVTNNKLKGYKTTPLGDKSFVNVTRER